jgi:dTDP-4-dehydrorhamnose 3,5-epimerase
MSLANSTPTRMEGLFQLGFTVHSDERGSFKEAFRADHAQAAGLPVFPIVQTNISTSHRGVIRGIHAEPWEKYITVAAGTVFAAIVDLREDSPTFGEHETFEMNPEQGLFVARGFGNSFQALSDQSVYLYHVADHWRPRLSYPAIAYNDPDLAIAWPIKDVVVSAKDQANPTMRTLYPQWSPS